MHKNICIMMISYTPLSHTAFMQDSGHDIKFTWCDQVTGGARTQGQQKKQKHDCSAKHGWAHNEHVEVDQRSDVMSTVVTSTYLCRTTCCVRCRVRPDTIGYYWWWSQSQSSHETILFLMKLSSFCSSRKSGGAVVNFNRCQVQM